MTEFTLVPTQRGTLYEKIRLLFAVLSLLIFVTCYADGNMVNVKGLDPVKMIQAFYHYAEPSQFEIEQFGDFKHILSDEEASQFVGKK